MFSLFFTTLENSDTLERSLVIRLAGGTLLQHLIGLSPKIIQSVHVLPQVTRLARKVLFINKPSDVSNST